VALLAQCDAGHSAVRCDWQRARYASSWLCSGFLAIASTADTRRLFDPALVFADGRCARSPPKAKATLKTS
jgi:hypothetical protein